MRVLVIGAGGREHALAWAIARSPRLEKLFVAPGNGGTQRLATNVAIDIDDHAAVLDLARAERIDLVVIGPDAQVVAGLADEVRAAGIACFGPSRAAAQLEGSKAFTKAICTEAGVPTAAYRRFDEEAAALAYVRERGAPIVVKADGLAAGKGVTVAETLAEAEAAIRHCFAGAFGAAGHSLVIEEKLEGEEASLFAVCDGTTAVLLPSAQDHKRALDGDRGPNTGGMGAYSPAPVMTEAMMERCRREIIEPALRALAKRGTPFSGVLFAGLMIGPAGPKLIEFNVRFGDPECQVLMMRLRSDVLDLLWGSATGSLAGVVPQFTEEVALTVVMASRGYPGPYHCPTDINGRLPEFDGKTMIFHAGTAYEHDKLRAVAGRVLNVTALGATVAEARDRAYAAVAAIDWPEGFCRHDIGWRALQRPGN